MPCKKQYVPPEHEWWLLPTSQKEAIAVGEVYYCTGKPCKRGHIAPRTTRRGECILCVRLRSKKHYEEHIRPELEKKKEERAKQREAEAPERAKRAKEYNRVFYRRQRSRRRKELGGTEAEYADSAAKKREAYWKDPEKYRERRRERTLRGISGLRARELRTPPWQTEDEHDAIASFYANCPEDSVVDHIVPTVHPVLAGLHTLANLQYLTRRQNIKKGNKFECTQEDASNYIARGLAVLACDVDEYGSISWERYAYSEGCIIRL